MAKGVIIDVGFKADIKDFIDSIQQDFQRINFDGIIGLSNAFDKQAKDVRNQLSKLQKEIDETINGKIPNNPEQQLQSLNKAVGVLMTSFRELVKHVPNMDQGLVHQLDGITGEISQLSAVCTNAADAVKSLQNATTGDVQFVDTTQLAKQKKELENFYKLFRKTVNEVRDIDDVALKKESGNTPYKEVYSVYAKMEEIYKRWDIASEGYYDALDTQDVNKIDRAAQSYLQYTNELLRLLKTYQSLDGAMDDTLALSDSFETPMHDLKDVITKDFDEVKDYLYKRMNEINNLYQSIGGQDLEKKFEKQISQQSLETSPLKVPLGISTRPSTLAEEAISIIQLAQKRLADSPLEVEIRLMSPYKTKKNQEALNQIMNGLSQIEDETIRNELTSLIDKMNKDIDNALLFNVNVNTERATQAVRKFVTDAKEELNQLSQNLVPLEPEVILTEAHRTAFQKQLDQAKGDFKIQVGIMDGEDTVDHNATKKELSYLKLLRERVEAVETAVNNKSLAFIDEEGIVRDIVDNERTYLNQLYGDLLLIEEQIKDVCSAFEAIPQTFTMDFDSDIFKSLDQLANHEALSKISDAKQLVELAISSSAGDAVIVPKDQKDKLLKDVEELSAEIKTIFETESMQNWSSEFISSLDEIKKRAEETATAIKEVVNQTQGKQISIDQEIKDIAGSTVDTIIDGEINKLNELEQKLDQVIDAVNRKTEAFKNEGRVVGEVADGEIANLNPLQNLDSAYNLFKPFYDNNDLESEEGAKAALSYYNAYKEALISKVNKKDLKQYTIGKESDLFTGNYTNYKKGLGELDLSGLNSQVEKYSNIIENLNQPKLINIINALSEAIEKLLSQDNVNNDITKLLEQLNKAINNLGSNKSAEKIERIAQNLENFQKSINALDLSDSGFIQSLSSIFEKGEELKALGEVLKSTKKQIDEAGKALKAEDNLKQSQKYLEQYKNDINTAVNNKYGNENVLYQQLQATKDGVVQVTAMVKEGENAYKKYVLTTTNGSDLMVKSINDNAAALSKEVKQWQTYQKLKDLAVPGAKNLGEDGVTFTPESSNWDQLVDKVHEFGIEVKDIEKIIRNVDEIGHESFQIFTKLSRITVGMDSNGILFQKDEVLDVNKVIKDFENNVINLEKSLKKSFSDDIGIEQFLKTLKDTSEVYQELIALNQKGLISDDDVSSAISYFNAFKTSLSAFSLDNISTDKKTPEFIKQFELAKDQLVSFKNVLDKVNVGQAFSDEDINQVKLLISQIRKLYNTMGDKENKLAASQTIDKTLEKIYKNLDKNSAMSEDLKRRFQELAAEMKSFGNNMPADKVNEFTAEFQALEREMWETGQTGLSFFDGIIKRAKSMSQSFISMYLSLWDIVRYIRTGITYIRDLDTALTEMRKVSDESVSSLKEFQKVSFDIAGAVGTTAKQIQNSTADWLRLGEAFDEAQKSAKVANILLNVSEFGSIDEATESLVSMSAAYDELDKMDIIDKLNEVGNNFSISTDGLATALQKSASALKTAGNDMNEAVALITAGNAVVQNADSVGTGMQTIALRLTGTKEASDQLEELGEDTEGVITTVSKLRNTILSATKVASNGFKGFDILDENGNYKSTYEIMLGLSEIYKEIEETDKKMGNNNLNLLLETLAGESFCLKFVEIHFYRTHLNARIA